MPVGHDDTPCVRYGADSCVDVIDVAEGGLEEDASDLSGQEISALFR